MITNNPSWPEWEFSSKSLDANAVRKLEELWLSNKASKALASLKAEMSDTERNDQVTKAVEQQFPWQDNTERIKNALSALEQSRDRIAKNLWEQFKSERASLAEKIDIPINKATPQGFTKNIAEETTAWLKAFFWNSLPKAGKLAWKFFTDIPKAFSDLNASTEYLIAQADWIYNEPQANNTINS